MSEIPPCGDFLNLKLIRYINPVFAPPWSMMQRIDESIPPCAWEKDHRTVGNTEIIADLCGFDKESDQIVHSGWAYETDDIC